MNKIGNGDDSYKFMPIKTENKEIFIKNMPIFDPAKVHAKSLKGRVSVIHETSPLSIDLPKQN